MNARHLARLSDLAQRFEGESGQHAEPAARSVAELESAHDAILARCLEASRRGARQVDDAFRDVPALSSHRHYVAHRLVDAGFNLVDESGFVLGGSVCPVPIGKVAVYW